MRDAVGGRKLLYIATGNVLRAESILTGQGGAGGELANFTLAGKTSPILGLVMPAKFAPGPLGKQNYGLRTPQSAANFALDAWSSLLVRHEAERQMDEQTDLIKSIKEANPYKGDSIDPGLVNQYRERILRGKGDAWLLGIRHYSPSRGFVLSIAGDMKKIATSREIRALLGGDMGKKRGDPFYVLDRNAPDLKDPAKIVALIKVLSRFSPATVVPELAEHAKLIVKDEFDTSEKRKGLRSASPGAAAGQTADAVREQSAKQASAIPGITVTVVQSSSDLPGRAAPSDTEGVWYEGTTVYLVADNLPTARRVQEVLAHEAIGHAALEALLGPQLMAQLVQNVQNLEKLGNRAIKDIAAYVDKVQPNLSPARRAKEIVAIMAETGQHKGLWSRIVQVVRGWLRDRGFTLDFSEQDIRAMLRDAEKFVGRSSTAQSGASAGGAFPAYSGAGLLQHGVVKGDVSQAISSAATSRKQVPAAMNQITWAKDSTNLDIGAGRFSDATEFLAGKGVENLEFDPFNRSADDNFTALSQVVQGPTATVTALNVLNVIAEPEARDNLIRRAAKAVAQDGVAYFQTYEGNGTGVGATSRDGWQENRKTATYMAEIGKHFASVVRHGQVIQARDPLKVAGDSWQQQDGSIYFSRRLFDRLMDWSEPKYDRVKADAEAAALAAKSSAIGQKASQIVTSAPVKATGRAISYGASKAALSTVYAAGKTANGIGHVVNNPVTRAALTFITPPARLAGKGIALAAKGAAIPLSVANRAADTVLKNATGLGFIAKHLTGPVYDAVVRQITENDLGDSRLGRFAETMRSGLISQYGLTEADKQRHIDMTSAINRELRYTKGLVEQLHGITRDESRLMYLWLNTQPTGSSDASTDPEQVLFNSLPEESKALMREIKQKLVDMGKEAVSLGLLDKQTWEKNLYAYLHRDYAKYEFAQTAHSQQRANTLSIMADSFKHRGMNGLIESVNVIADDHAAAIAKGARLVRLDQMSKNGLKVRKRVWIPEVLDAQGAPIIPKDYDGWKQDAGAWDVRSADNGKVKVWRDFTPDERKILGELDEARYAVATTISQLAHDIEVAKYLKWVADEHSVKEDTIDPEMIVKAYDFQMLLGDVRRGSYVRVPDTVVSDTTRVKKYGALAGKIIPAPMWNEIRQVKNRSKPLGDTYDQFLRMWKMNKTVLSPVTHMNNTISNFIMGDLHDVQPIDVVRALELLHKKGKGDAASIKMIERFEDSGAMHGTFLNAEMRTDLIQPLLDKLRAEMTGQLGDLDAQITLNQIVSLINDKEWTKAVTALQFSQGADYTKKFINAMSSAYQNEDAVFRLAKFMSDVNAGMTDREAGKNAREAFLDYDITAPWIQNMRATNFPFIAFAYRMIPKLMWIGAHKPWKLAKYSSLFYLAGILGMAMGGIDKDEWERMRKLLPQNKMGLSPFFGDRIIPIGKDKHGRIVTIDVSRWIPSSDAFEVTGGDTNVLPMWVPFNPGGPLTLAVELLANKSLFTGKPIWLASDTGPTDMDRYGMEAPMKATEYIWKTLAPNMPGLPGTYTTDKMMNAWNANTDQFGREFTLPTAALSAVGIKVAPMGLDSLQRNEILKMERNVREIRAGITQKAKGASPVQQEGLNRALVTQEAKIQNEAAITQKRLNP